MGLIIGEVMQIIKHVAISIKQKVKPALARPNYFAFGFLGLWFGFIPIFCLGLSRLEGIFTSKKKKTATKTKRLGLIELTPIKAL